MSTLKQKNQIDASYNDYETEYQNPTAHKSVGDFSSNQDILTRRVIDSDEIDSYATRSYERADTSYKGYESNQRQALKTVAISDSDSETASQTKLHLKISARLKTIIAIYALVVLTLAVIVVLNVTLLTRISNDNSKLRNEISAVSGEITQMGNQLNNGQDQSAMKDEALNSGMVAGGGTVVEFDPVEIGSKPVVETPKGWFDKICDFFSSIF